jgi:hypothetical protein
MRRRVVLQLQRFDPFLWMNSMTASCVTAIRAGNGVGIACSLRRTVSASDLRSRLPASLRGRCRHHHVVHRPVVEGSLQAERDVVGPVV